MRDSSEHDSEKLLHEDQQDEEDSVGALWGAGTSSFLGRHGKDQRFPWTTIGILAVSNAISLITILLLLSRQQSHQQCPLPLNQPPGGLSPSFEGMIQDPLPKFINISFFSDGQFFRDHDSVIADQMWRDYDGTGSGFIMISKEEAELGRAGIDPSRHAYVDRPDLGAVGYPVLPEAIHDMHCVNMLRQNLYYNIDHTRKHCPQETCESPELEPWRIGHVGKWFPRPGGRPTGRQVLHDLVTDL
jgi:hypothetical protein